MRNVILATQSPSRRELFERLQIPHITTNPDIDETPKPEETGSDLVVRLAIEKAKSMQDKYSNHIIIGCDQVALFNNEIYGKPKTHAKTKELLAKFSGNTVDFCNGLCVYDSNNGDYLTNLEYTHVTYKLFSDEAVERYLKKEQPFNCAGGLKSEGIGISLIEKITSKDPNMLAGLPLIALLKMLAKFEVFAY